MDDANQAVADQRKQSESIDDLVAELAGKNTGPGRSESSGQQIIGRCIDCIPVIPLLENRWRSVRRAGAYALWMSDWELTDAAIDALLEAIDDEDLHVATLAIKALGRKQIKRAEEDISSVIDPEEPTISAAAIRSLAWLGADDLINDVRDFLASGNPRLIKAAADAAAHANLPECGESLFELLKKHRSDAAPTGRNPWISCLRKVIQAIAALRVEEAVPVLTEMATSHFGLRTESLRALRDMDVNIDELLAEKYLEQPSESLRKLLASAEDQEFVRGILEQVGEIPRERQGIPRTPGAVRLKQNLETLAALGESFHEGAIVDATIDEVEERFAWVTLENGISTILYADEYAWKRTSDLRKRIGFDLHVRVLVTAIDRNDGRVSISRKRLEDDPWQGLEDRVELNKPIRATVSGTVVYGVFVSIDQNVTGLLHVSDLPELPGRELADDFHPGDEITVRLLEINREDRRLRLGFVDDENVRLLRGCEEEIHVGARVTAFVDEVTRKYALVTVGDDIIASIEAREISWTHVEDVQEHLRGGEEIDVVILTIDRESGLVTAGIRQLTTDPLVKFSQKHSPGSICDGTVSKITRFGAFVQLESNVIGLLHWEALGPKGESESDDRISVGDQLSVEILEIDTAERRIRLAPVKN